MAHSDKYDATKRRGTKRQRPSVRKPAIKQESRAEVIAKKLHHGMHEVRKAAKKAETFELRKLVKRLKAARTDGVEGSKKGDDPAEMERQLEVLKHADHERFGRTALRTKILKDGLLSRSEDVKGAVEDKLSEENVVAPRPEPGSSAAKVHARLLSSKILADAVRAVVDALREVLNPALAKERARKGVEEEGESDEEVEESEEEADDADERSWKGRKARSVDEGVEDQESGSEAEVEDEDDGAGWESGTVDGTDGDDGAGWESGSINEDGAIAVANSSDESDEDLDQDEVDDEEDSDSAADDSDAPPAKKAKPSGKESKGKSKAAGESTFLPSLSVGFTRGDSDASDISDDEAAAADAPRKNRRGQRARRAIWEKKYGRNANHVKKQQQRHDPRQHQKQDPRSGRDERGPKSKAGPLPHQARGANVHDDARHSGGAGPERNVGAGGGRGAKGALGEKPLHPSWEAKRKLKEKLNPGIMPAQGKKITFS